MKRQKSFRLTEEQISRFDRIKEDLGLGGDSNTFAAMIGAAERDRAIKTMPGNAEDVKSFNRYLTGIGGLYNAALDAVVDARARAEAAVSDEIAAKDDEIADLREQLAEERNRRASAEMREEAATDERNAIAEQFNAVDSRLAALEDEGTAEAGAGAAAAQRRGRPEGRGAR